MISVNGNRSGKIQIMHWGFVLISSRPCHFPGVCSNRICIIVLVIMAISAVAATCYIAPVTSSINATEAGELSIIMFRDQTTV